MEARGSLDKTMEEGPSSEVTDHLRRGNQFKCVQGGDTKRLRPGESCAVPTGVLGELLVGKEKSGKTVKKRQNRWGSDLFQRRGEKARGLASIPKTKGGKACNHRHSSRAYEKPVQSKEGHRKRPLLVGGNADEIPTNVPSRLGT